MKADEEVKQQLISVMLKFLENNFDVVFSSYVNIHDNYETAKSKFIAEYKEHANKLSLEELKVECKLLIEPKNTK